MGKIVINDEDDRTGSISTTDAQNYPEKVWKKFLAYLTPKEAILACSLSNSSSIKETKEIIKIRERLKVASLLDDYMSGNLSDDDFKFVDDYMSDKSLLEFVRDRMEGKFVETWQKVHSMGSEENISKYIAR